MKAKKVQKYPSVYVALHPGQPVDIETGRVHPADSTELRVRRIDVDSGGVAGELGQEVVLLLAMETLHHLAIAKEVEVRPLGRGDRVGRGREGDFLLQLAAQRLGQVLPAILIGAPAGLGGILVIDVGLLEI